MSASFFGERPFCPQPSSNFSIKNKWILTSVSAARIRCQSRAGLSQNLLLPAWTIWGRSNNTPSWNPRRHVARLHHPSQAPPLIPVWILKHPNPHDPFRSPSLPRAIHSPPVFVLLLALTPRRALLHLFHLPPLLLFAVARRGWDSPASTQLRKYKRSPPEAGTGVLVGGRGRRQSPVVAAMRRDGGRDGRTEESTLLFCAEFFILIHEIYIAEGSG